ncbi:MAG TPA: DNA adenine methylase [Candidatus Methanofastidiosum sp.]|nr:DNA adenine methylase [Methanofastidiosum sp.]
MELIKSPLRYPGGKSRAIKQILPLIPQFKEYREPFLGGGSLYISLKQKEPSKSYWVNDLNYDLFLFWKYAQQKNLDLVDAIIKKKAQYSNGKELFNEYKGNWDAYSDFDRAVRFFILNRITFSGTIDSGGYSQESYDKRFTDSSIQRVRNLQDVLGDTTITNCDYERIVNEPGNDVFIFLDPPYFSLSKSKLYGKKGDLHANFDHQKFANDMKKCGHKWLITYDECDEINEMFNFAKYKKSWTLQYGMNNFGQLTAGKGNELFISNYPLEELSIKQFELDLDESHI